MPLMPGGAEYYPHNALELVEDVDGARLWAVGLKQAMLTYFEVDPHSHFEEHAHMSEQITFVLSGTLYFEVGGGVIAVKTGEVIALPSDVPHSVYTLEEAVTAVDAWAPIRTKYAR